MARKALLNDYAAGLDDPLRLLSELRGAYQSVLRGYEARPADNLMRRFRAAIRDSESSRRLDRLLAPTTIKPPLPPLHEKATRQLITAETALAPKFGFSSKQVNQIIRDLYHRPRAPEVLALTETDELIAMADIIHAQVLEQLAAASSRSLLAIRLRRRAGRRADMLVFALGAMLADLSNTSLFLSLSCELSKRAFGVVRDG